MKKINLIIALSVVTMGAAIPASVLMSNNQSVVENKEIVDDNVNDGQSIDTSDLYASNDNDKSKAVGDIINANSATCFAEDDTTKNANEWMGITGGGYVKFTIIKDYVNASDVGTVSVSGVSANTIASSKLTIPNYIINNGNRYDVTSIKEETFLNCSGLTGILTIPSSVTTIGDQAFINCTGLTALDLTNATSLKTILNSAFSGCSEMIGNLTIPANVTSIGNDAFFWL